MADRPNVLLLLTDDQRFDTIAALNNPFIKTPNLDRLVARGAAMENAYIMGGSSAAVCMPSRVMLNTGRTLYHIEREGQRIDPEHTMIGEHLQTAGYECFGTGKWHNGTDAYTRNFTAGASVFFGGMNDHWNVPVCDFHADGTYPEPVRLMARFGNVINYGHQVYEHMPSGKHSTDLFVDDTCAWLNQRDQSNPFYAYVAFMAPHDPREMPAKYLNMYPDVANTPLPENYLPEHPFDTGFLRIRDEMLEAFPRTERKVKKHLTEYYAMISHLDDRIGDLLDTLEETGELDNTIIIMTGDNGLAVGQHGLFGKQALYEHSIHVPLLISGPGVGIASRQQGLCYLIDIFPTICDLVGLETPASVEGQSLLPVIQGESAGRESLVFAMTQFQRAIREGDWKLIETAVENTRVTQLFDLAADPWEMKNLADDAEHAATVARLQRALREQWQALGDDREAQGADFWRQYDAA